MKKQIKIYNTKGAFENSNTRIKKKNTVEDQDELEIGTNKYTESRYLKVYTKICIW